MYLEKHLNLLGMTVEDKVTGFKGVVSSISFDLYGCIQAVVAPPINKDGKRDDGHWFDVGRLKITSKKSVMPVPDFSSNYSPIANGEKGPAEKPL